MYTWTTAGGHAHFHQPQYMRFLTKTGSSVLLFAAALSDQSRLVNSMASRGANINAPDIHGKTPLHYAIAAGSAKERMGDLEGMARSCVTVKVLLRQGANLMVKDALGKYPLTLASTDMSAVVEDEVYLLETGGNLQATVYGRV